MANYTSIAPALSRDEWIKQRKRFGRGAKRKDLIAHWRIDPTCGAVEGVEIEVSDEPFAVALTREMSPAFIALANHALPDDDSRKITRADVALLRVVADFGLDTDIQSTIPERLGAIAAKLAALLPPE